MRFFLVIILVFLSITNRGLAGNVLLKKKGLSNLEEITSLTDSVKASELFKPFKGFRWNGYVRTFLYYRKLTDRYPNLSGGTSTGAEWYSVNGGYNEPLMRLTARGNPAENLYFEVEYTFDNLLTGQGNFGDRGRVALPLQGLRFGGNYNTPYGRYTLMAGGIYWYNITSLTYGGFNSRYDPFERLPWEEEGNAWKRYSKFFENGGIAGGGSGNRFGSAATQGFVLEGNNLPNGFSMAAVYGKTGNTGGYQAWQTRSPKKIQVYRLAKKIGNHSLGLNYFNSFGNTDQFANKEEIITLTTSDFKIKLGEVMLTGEVGNGSYVNPVFPRQSGGVVNFTVKSSEKLTFIPVTIQAYHVSPNVVNPNSEMVNSSISSISDVYGNTSAGLFINKGAVTDCGQLTNNRQGVNLFFNRSTNKFRVALGMGVSEEIENNYDVVTFQHRLNKVARSKFNFFQNAVGPYKRLYSQYLTVFETTNIINQFGADSLGYKKGFNVIDLSLRFKFWLFGKEIILSNYTNYNTVQKKVALLPSSGNNPFVTLLYNEFTTYYNISRKTTLVGLIGYERNKGSNETELAYASDDTKGHKQGESILNKAGVPIADPTGKPIDQYGYAYGVGFDYNITDRAGLYFRERWFSHEDKSFIKDKFKGFESSIEFKVFF